MEIENLSKNFLPLRLIAVFHCVTTSSSTMYKFHKGCMLAVAYSQIQLTAVVRSHHGQARWSAVHGIFLAYVGEFGHRVKEASYDTMHKST